VLAEKEILAVVHSGKYGDRSAWCAPRERRHGLLAAFPCVQWEKRQVWVVEGTPGAVLTQYPYSKRVLYVDQEFFAPVVEEMYDKRGELWRYFLPCYFYYPNNMCIIRRFHRLPEDVAIDEWAYMPNGLWGMCNSRLRQRSSLLGDEIVGSMASSLVLQRRRRPQYAGDLHYAVSTARGTVASLRSRRRPPGDHRTIVSPRSARMRTGRSYLKAWNVRIVNVSRIWESSESGQ
jgi:hypothetical protein